MKAFIRNLFIIQLVCFCVFEASAQCLNNRGEKIVSKISVYKFSGGSSTLKPFVRFSVDFSYNEKKQLIGFDWTRSMLNHNDTKRYVINRDGDSFSCVEYVNGKTYDGVDQVFETNEDGRITSISFYSLGRNGAKILPGYLYRFHFMIWYDGEYVKGIAKNLSCIIGTSDWKHDSECSGFEAFNSDGNYNYRCVRSDYETESKLFFSSSYRYFGKEGFPAIYYNNEMEDMNVGVEQLLVLLNCSIISNVCDIVSYLACTEWVSLRSKNRVKYINIVGGKIIKFERSFRDGNVVSIDTYAISRSSRESKYFDYGEITCCRRTYHVEIEYLYD